MSGKGHRRAASQSGETPAQDTELDRRLLDPGWAGELSDREVEYIQRELGHSRRLWRKWGYLGALLKGVTIPASTIRKIAKHGLR
jgi:hypothetical protein